MKKVVIGVIGFVVALGLWFSVDVFRTTSKPSQKTVVAEPVGNSYWTCPMHPQVHSEHSGECPICHMRLVQVKAQQDPEQNARNGENRSEVVISEAQTALLGIQKHTVEKMDLKVLLPISGRFLSSASLAFQVYESDLRFVKAGLRFRGESSFYPEQEILGTISSVDSIVDPSSRTVRVVGAVTKSPRGLSPETSFRGEVEVDLKDRIAIPESSVLHTGTKDLVYVYAGGNKLLAREVKLGPKTESFYEVLNGLREGEVISSGPNFLIDSEARIRGVTETSAGQKKSGTPSCPEGQHWDIPMSMCMPGRG